MSASAAEYWHNKWSKADAAASKLGEYTGKLDAEVKRLREENDTLAEAVKGDNVILKKYIEALAEVDRLREGIQQALDAMSSHTNHRIYNSSWNILKELFE